MKLYGISLMMGKFLMLGFGILKHDKWLERKCHHLIISANNISFEHTCDTNISFEW